MISGGRVVDSFVEIHLILVAKFGDDLLRSHPASYSFAIASL